MKISVTIVTRTLLRNIIGDYLKVFRNTKVVPLKDDVVGVIPFRIWIHIMLLVVMIFVFIFTSFAFYIMIEGLQGTQTSGRR